MSKKEIDETFKQIIKNGQEIIHYSETIRDIDSVHVIIICGKLNEGNLQGKQIL